MTPSPTEFDYLARGQLFLRQGDTQAAIDNFTAALRINQEFAAAYYYRHSEFYRVAGRTSLVGTWYHLEASRPKGSRQAFEPASVPICHGMAEV